MKKIILLVNFFVLCLLVSAQTTVSINEGEPTLVYSLPKTELCIEVQIEKTIVKPGPFYRYSERYLATTNVITEEKTSYKLVSIDVKTKAEPDLSRTYSFVPAKNAASRLTVNSKGIICGLNVSAEEKVKANDSKTFVKPVSSSSELLPLGEEYMMAGSEAKLAEGAAKQIYRIRESRLAILTADVEKLPADGSSFKTVLAGLDNMENELTQLFIGKTTKQVETKKIYLTPAKALKDEVLFRLSAFNGLVAANDLSGTPYFITITPTTIPVNEADSKSKKQSVTLYSVLPASTQISIGDGVNTFYNNQFFIPQFGITIPVSEDLLRNSNTKIKYDIETGRILNIQ